MKNIYFLLLLITTQFSYSQSLNDTKYDSIVKIENTDLSLVYSKKKTAVWHGANFFVAQPTKNYFIFLEAAELLIEVDFKHKAFYAIVQDENTGGYKRFFLANDGFEADVFQTEYDGSFLLLDTTAYSLSLTKIENTGYRYKIGEIGLQLNDHFLHVTDFKNSFYDKFNEFPLMSIEYPGEDSISIEGNFVYPPVEIFPGVQNSGVYNFKEKNWTIKPNYSQLITYQNKILMSTELDSNKINYDTTSFYTLFQISKYKAITIKNNITNNNKEVVSLMTSYDSIQQLNDQIHYITYKNGKQGLMEYQLFQNDYDHTQKINFFQNSILLEPINDFVYYSLRQDVSISKTDNFYTINSYRYGEGTISEDSIPVSGIVGDNNDEETFINLGFNQINDSLLLIKDIIFEYQEEYPLFDQYGEDSMIVNKNGEWDYAYPAPDPGQYHCGLYNLKQSKWVIEPNEYDIQYFGGNSVVVEKPIFDERHIIQSTGYKSIYTLNGELIITDQSTEDLVTKNNNLEKILLQNNETLEPYNIGQFSNTNIPDTLISAPYYYKIKKENKEKISILDYSGSSEITSTSSEYHNLILFDTQSKFNLYLDNNKSSLSFSILEDSLDIYLIKNSDYKMEIYTVLDYEYILSALAVIMTDKDTIFYEFGMKSEEKKATEILADYKNRTKRVITISKIKNEIIYNISNTNGNYHFYGTDYEEYGESDENFTHNWEQEYAAVYRKTNENWNKVSPNYNVITKVPFGYICKTGSYSYVHSVYFGDEVLEQKTILASYILLDSTLKPIGYSDFYNFDLIEDLGFGLKICPVMEKDDFNRPIGHGNCFFVDYNGRVLCDAKYDSFEIKDSKIYGIKNEVPQIDMEYGGEAYDYETGEPILLQQYERVLIGEIEN